MTMTRNGVMGSIILGLLITTSCATTNLESYRAPEFAGNPFRKVLVMAPLAEFTLRTQAEHAFVERITLGSTQAVASGTVLAPDRIYKEAEFKEILANYGVDGVLMITLTSKYNQQIEIPGHTSCTSALVSANSALLESSECTVGNTISRPTVEFKFRLYDVASNQTVWEAASSTQGTTLTRFGTLADSLAATTVKRLTREGLIR
jgi:hypothetical protein